MNFSDRVRVVVWAAAAAVVVVVVGRQEWIKGGNKIKVDYVLSQKGM